MYKILKKTRLAPAIKYMRVEAPLVARKAKPGQFIILRVMEEGNGFPYNYRLQSQKDGFHSVSGSRPNHSRPGRLEEREFIRDFVDPRKTFRLR